VYLLIYRHGGDGAAKFAANQIVSFLEKTPQWVTYVAEGASNPELLGQALQQAFESIDAAMREHQNGTREDSSGCTACAAVITPTHIVCANAGDTRCIMSVSRGVKELSFDHKPSNMPERKRIEAAGGRVQFDRVDGDLAVSRAFGDFQFKNRSDLPPKDQKVSCLPDITVHERTPHDDMFIIACDGFWDVNTNTVAVQYVNSLHADGENNVVKVAEELVEMAFEKGEHSCKPILSVLCYDVGPCFVGSKDNISVLFASLPGAVIGDPAGGGVDKKRKERQENEERRKKERDDRDERRALKK
jgi:serine/threonine protein phosphatase PrpC